MVAIPKLIINKIKYRWRYPGISIASSVNISSNVSLSERVSIGPFTTIENSKLNKSTIVSSHCTLKHVITENNVALNSNGYFDELLIGRYSYVAPDAKISMARIGRFCSIGPEIICGYGDHPINWVSTSPVFFSTLRQCGETFADKDLFEERKPIVIDNDVWIGARVFIRDGVRIGNGAVIAAGAVVVKDVPDYAVVGGVPAKVIRYRFSPEAIGSLLSISWWNWPEDRIRLAQPYLSQNDLYSFFCWARLQ
jgi:chloramphenicol O-acetyltransferase type B